MSKDKDKAPRSFAVFLANLAEGDANKELSEALDELSRKLQTEALSRNGMSKGSLTIKLNMAIDPRGVVAVGWDVATREPKPSRTGGVMFVDDDGYLTHENPRQQKQLAFRDVNNERRFVEVQDAGRTFADVQDDKGMFDPETGEVRRAP